ncbi:MAG: hypothetical protein PQJ48_00850 [Sphaerochaetaceae bacterium]|nr:hypothetical protein [Sphaerochaetaceae bacterium]
MPNITLICTKHAENGACNFRQLYQRIEVIQPDVIFEELPPSMLKDYYINKTRTNLETKTIITYLEEHRTKHIPVDLEMDLSVFFEKNNKLHERVERNSYEYHDLVDLNSKYTFLYGFKYLNSDYCNNNYSALYEAIEKTLMKLRKDDLFEIYKNWTEVIEKRELEMIQNIYQYCQDFDFEKGLFFIGAAHRKSIMEKIKVRFCGSKIDWYFEDYTDYLRN